MLSVPGPFKASNNSSALNEQEFVEQAINELLFLGCVCEVSTEPDIINPLSVSIQNSGKKRLILDLRHVNKYIFKNKFRCEDISVAKEILNPGDFMFTFDLKSGYHHVEIFEDHRKYLSFSWKFSNGSVRYFQFCVLPFGLSSAPYLFTKLLKPLVKKWRSEGFTIVVYLDDGLGAARSYILAKAVSLQMHADLLKFGFLPNESKCHWDPVLSITWLGVVFDTSAGLISATSRRIDSLLSDIDNIVEHKSKSFHVKTIASVCGKIISLGSCVGNVSRLMSRHTHALINSASTWHSYVTLNEDVLKELLFWRVNLAKLNGIPIWPIKSAPTKVVYSDASDTGCGSLLETGGELFQQNWSEYESTKSSTYRELLTVSLALKSFVNRLKAQTVLWYTDNKNVTQIISCGSRIEELQSIAFDIFSSCVRNGIHLDVQWIPRDLNSVSDDMSRVVDFDDYTIHDDVFNTIDWVWGPHSCDRFACYYNTKLVKYNSRYFQPGTSGVNAFSQDWQYDNNWLCPPVYLTCKVLKHLRACNAQGTLIVPVWKSAHFWPLLCADGVHWNGFIHDWLVLPNHPKLFLKCKAQNCIFGNKPLRFATVALRIDFGIPQRLNNAKFAIVM